MAFGLLSSRRSSQWTGSDTSSNVTRRLAVAGAALLLLGSLIGVGFGSLLSHRSSGSSDSAIANATTSDMDYAPHTADGAVRAVTSYITGFPSVALQSSGDQQKVLNDILSPNADPSLQKALSDSLTNARQRLIGSGALSGTLQARLIVTPASYKVDMLSNDRARVQVWFMNVYVDASGQTAQSSWATNDIQVQWTDHWRLATFSGKGGPTPSLSSEGGIPSTFPDVVSVINGFQPFRYATTPSSGS